jgi:hypothetical protein
MLQINHSNRNNFESKITFWEVDGNTKLITSTVENFSINDFDFKKTYSY